MLRKINEIALGSDLVIKVLKTTSNSFDFCNPEGNNKEVRKKQQKSTKERTGPDPFLFAVQTCQQKINGKETPLGTAFPWERSPATPTAMGQETPQQREGDFSPRKGISAPGKGRGFKAREVQHCVQLRHGAEP